MLERPNAPRALLLTGTGRYAATEDSLAATSQTLADLLQDAGFDVVVAADVESALAWLSSPWNWPELLAVNVAAPRDGLAVPAEAAAAGLRSWLGSGRPLLAVGTSSTSFAGVPEWEAALSGTEAPAPVPVPGHLPVSSQPVSFQRPDGGRTFHAPAGADSISANSAEHREVLAGGIAWLAESLEPVSAAPQEH